MRCAARARVTSRSTMSFVGISDTAVFMAWLPQAGVRR
jgi:hypothetical protein